jgi:hypothetical protein
MSPEGLFALANPLAMLGWLALALFPFRRAVNWWLCGVTLPLVLSALYVAALATGLPGAQGGFSSLPGVMALFEAPWVALAGWVHYLAFDLFIGAWMARRAAAEGWSRWALLPCLPLTFLAGPVGLLLFLALSAARGRQAVMA